MSAGFVLGHLALLAVVLLFVASGLGQRLRSMQPPPYDWERD